MKYASIPSAWLALSPTHRLDADFWLAVDLEARTIGVARDNLAGIEAIVKRLSVMDRSGLGALIEKAKALADPVLRNPKPKRKFS